MYIEIEFACIDLFVFLICSGTTTRSRKEAYKNPNNFDLIYFVLRTIAEKGRS